jgi:hypothetical protein
VAHLKLLEHKAKSGGVGPLLNKTEDTVEMIRLIATSLRRAIQLLKEMNIPDFDCAAFESEFLALATREGWLA